MAPDVRQGLEALLAHRADIIREAIAICEIPAPTLQEERRAAHVRQRMEALDLGTPRTDPVGDVICELPGRSDRPTVVLMAHLDTVFPIDTPIVVRQDGDRLYGPGIGDNSIAVAALLWLGRYLKPLHDRGPLVLAANVCEEGLGNLRGARAVWEQYGPKANAWVILEGASFNRAIAIGVCSRRLSVVYRTGGGHSWQDFGRPSAIHALGRLIDQVAQIQVSKDPKTTYNVGIIQGGSSVNTIASEASLILDMRSVDAQALATLDGVVGSLVRSIAKASGVEPSIEVVGDRAGGVLPPDHRLARLVNETAESLGTPVSWEAGSTDTNVPLSHGAAAVCLGIAKGEHLHTVEEVLDVSVMDKGLQQGYLVLAALLRGG